MLEAGRNHYILALIRALEKRAIDGALDEVLAGRIERLLGVGEPDPAGEAEYASWSHVSGVAPTPAGWRFKSRVGGEWHFDSTKPTGHVFCVEPVYACGVPGTAQPQQQNPEK